MIRIIAVLCSINDPTICHDQQITNSDFQDGLTMTDCMVGMPRVAKFMESFPQYRLKSWKCEIGTRIKREHI